MDASAQSGDFLRSAGESVGSFLAGIPPALGHFFGGLGASAGVNGVLDWTTLLFGIALLLSTIQGLMRGRIVGSALRGVMGVALMGWAMT